MKYRRRGIVKFCIKQMYSFRDEICNDSVREQKKREKKTIQSEMNMVT